MNQDVFQLLFIILIDDHCFIHNLFSDKFKIYITSQKLVSMGDLRLMQTHIIYLYVQNAQLQGYSL